MESPSRRVGGRASAVLVFCIAGTAGAGPITLDETDRGFYLNDGRHQEANENTNTGRFSNLFYKSWIVFDLPALPREIITGASLKLELAGHFGSGTENFNVTGVATAVATLVADHPDINNPEGLGIFAELGTGPLFANVDIIPSQQGTIVDIPLSGVIASELTAAIGQRFAFAFESLTDDEPDGFGTDGFRWSSGNEDRMLQLVLETAVPAPATITLAALGLFLTSRRRR